jgi:hypothetical protein
VNFNIRNCGGLQFTVCQAAFVQAEGDIVIYPLNFNFYETFSVSFLILTPLKIMMS